MEQTCRGHHTGSGRAGVILLALALAAGSLAGCGRRNDLPVIENGTGGTGEDIRLPDGSLVTPDTAPDAGEASVAQTGSYDAASVTAVVTLTGDGATVSGNGVSVSGSVVTFTSAGTYLISGDLADGQLIVATADATADTEKVRLVLNGVSVACSTGPAVFVRSSPKKTVLYTAAGSVNLLSDGSGYIVEDAEQTEGEVYPNACVYACDDLRLDGEGTLRITGNADKGINTKDDLEITGGTLIVTRPGTAADDGIHADDTVLLQDGEAYIRSGDDGVHADRVLTLSGGSLEIAQSYEGLEAAQITVSGGRTRITASDDGINASSGDGGSMGGGRPGGFGGGGRPGGRSGGTADGQTAGGTATDTLTPLLTVSGGYTAVYASGDGIDSNGNIVMTGGTLLVFGPTDNGNGAIDYGDGNCSMTISGGNRNGLRAGGVRRCLPLLGRGRHADRAVRCRREPALRLPPAEGHQLNRIQLRRTDLRRDLHTGAGRHRRGGRGRRAGSVHLDGLQHARVTGGRVRAHKWDTGGLYQEVPLYFPIGIRFRPRRESRCAGCGTSRRRDAPCPSASPASPAERQRETPG